MLCATRLSAASEQAQSSAPGSVASHPSSTSSDCRPDRLIYLAHGIAAILAFIGVKLMLHAMHENNLGFINDGESIKVTEISTNVSLSVLLGVLLVTVLASIFGSAGKAQNAHRHASAYLDSKCTKDPPA